MVEPRKAAACIILNGDAPQQVLMIKRSEKLRFMAGHYAFPGGRIDDAEGSRNVIGAPDDDEAVAIHAAAREVFEETGLLCVEGELPPLDEIKAARRAMLAEKESFDDILERYSLKIDAAQFEPAGLWITPKLSPIRFHTRYYLHHHRGERYEELIEGEIAGIEWFDPRETRRRWRQNEIKVPAPVAYVLHQLHMFPHPEVLRQLRRTCHITPADPGRIEWRCGVYGLPLRTPTIPPATHTNCLIVGEQELYVIDPGTPYDEERDRLTDQIQHLLEMGGRVAAVLLSHGHPDHTGAAVFVKERYNVPIWAHEITAGRVDFDVDRYLTDNEVITIPGDPDWRLRCLHTPGHDPGHLAFLEETTGLLYAGDMIAGEGTIVVSPDHGGDMTEYLNSLDRLLEEDYDLMIPAHGYSITNPKEKVREYIDHRLERESKIKAAVDGGATSMKDLLAVAYDDVPPAVWKLAEHSLRSHLIRLGVEVAED